jgi:hypothetical protein
MHMNLLYDIPAWTFYVSAGCCGIVWIWTGLLIILLEAAVLRLLRWGTFQRSLLDAFLMNLASTVIGGVIVAVFLFTETTPRVLLALLGGWALSIGIEGATLMLINAIRKTERHPAGQIWLASLVANTASYALLGILVLFGTFLDL